MSVKWNKKSKFQDSLLKKIDGCKSISEDGNISFSAFGLDDNKAALNHMLDFNSEMPDYEKRKIIWQGLVNVGKKTKIESNSFIKELSNLQGNYLKRKKKNYILASSLSLSHIVKIPKKVIEKSTFTFTRYLPKGFYLEKEKIYEYARHSIFGEIPNNYLSLRISIQGRSEYDAIDNALHKLDFLRGVWNLYFNRSQGMRRSSNQKKPVNKILLGPIQTLHHPNGKTVSSAYWYEASFMGAENLFDCNHNVDNMFTFETSARRFINSHKFKDIIISLVVRYCRALDEPNLSSSFLMLWGVLESLTGSMNDSYSVTIRRTAFTWKEPEYHSQILENLRIYRNSSVHTGSISSDIETYVYQLKRYVESLLEFHIANKFKFVSIKEAGEFMDLSINIDDLKKRKKLVSSALKYRMG